MFSNIRNNWQKSKGAVRVETALQLSHLPYLLPQDGRLFANSLVENVWSTGAKLYDGSSGPRLHPSCLAIAALSQGSVDNRHSRVAQAICLSALSCLLAEIMANRYEYALSGLDLIVINNAQDILVEETGPMPPGHSNNAQPFDSQTNSKSVVEANLTTRKAELDRRLKNALG